MLCLNFKVTQIFVVNVNKLIKSVKVIYTMTICFLQGLCNKKCILQGGSHKQTR